MKKQDLYRLKQSFEALGDIEDVNFAYVIVKNLKLIEKEIEVLEEVRKPSKEFMEIVQPEINEIVEKYSKDGKIIEDKREQLEKELKELEEKHREIVDKRLEQVNKFNQLLGEEIKLDLVKIKKKDLPKSIKVSELYNISEIIEDL